MNDSSENLSPTEDLDLIWEMLENDYELTVNKIDRPVDLAVEEPVRCEEHENLPDVPSGLLDDEGLHHDDRWQRQVNTWTFVKKKFNLSNARYSEFKYLLYLNVNDPFIENYVSYQLSKCEPLIKGRLRNHLNQWEKLNSPKWLLSTIQNGVKLPFKSEPPCMVLPNNKTANKPENILWIRETLEEFIKFGFVKKVFSPPKLIMPLQVAIHSSGKKCLIHDETPLNEYIEKSKFKNEGWEEMFNYSISAKYAIQFDLKKFYHEIDISEDHQQYFGFMYSMGNGEAPTYFVWTVLPYGYTRAPFLTRSLMKPLISKWRSLGIFTVVFVDDGMAVSENEEFLKKASLQIQCDLLRCGLFPGLEKCFWDPITNVQWIGLKWDFELGGISIMKQRILKCKARADLLLEMWPNVLFREVSRFVGQLNSMHAVLEGRCQLRSRFLQMIINTRNFFDCSWDKIIFSDNSKLFDYAKNEICFWIYHIEKINFRPFISPPPNCFAWTDASGYAAGGIACKIKDEIIGSYRPKTADNLLIPITGMSGLGVLKDCAQWQVDGVPKSLQSSMVRDQYDLNPSLIEEFKFVHYMFDSFQKQVDSNEREMIGAREVIIGSKDIIKNSNISLHLDNINAAIIFEKGSSKFRLHKYAIEMDNLSIAWNFKLNTIAIPRSMNNFSDKISKCIDYEDYGVTDEFFEKANLSCGIFCNFDRFANNWNTKTALFNSSSFCVGTSGVDCFNYPWGHGSINWLFPPPRLILKTINHLKLSRGTGLLVTPEWKSSHFFPYLISPEIKKFTVKNVRFSGLNVFKSGSDKSSFFGPDFNSGVIIWHLDFR